MAVKGNAYKNGATLPAIESITGAEKMLIYNTSNSLKTIEFDDLATELSAGITAILANNFTGALNSIQHAKVDANNQPNYLSESSGVITLSGSVTTFRCNIANGWGDQGLETIKFNISVDTLTLDLSGEVDDTYYLFLDYNSTTEVISLVSSTIHPQFKSNPDSSPASGQIWYDTINNIVKESDGSSWTQVHKLYIGKVVRSGSGSTYTISHRNFNETIPKTYIRVIKNSLSVASTSSATVPFNILGGETRDVNNDFLEEYDMSTYTFTIKGNKKLLFSVYSSTNITSGYYGYMLKYNGTEILRDRLGYVAGIEYGMTEYLLNCIDGDTIQILVYFAGAPNPSNFTTVLTVVEL